MRLASDLTPLLTCATLWLGWSLLVGACANALPLRWLQAEPAREFSSSAARRPGFLMPVTHFPAESARPAWPAANRRRCGA
jgi:hypothetical protein